MPQSQLTITSKISSDSSWGEIYNCIFNGRADSILSVGDIIDCVLKNGEHIKIDIAGINVYNANEVVFCFHDIFDLYVMNERHASDGGFPRADMIAHLDEIYELLPDDLQAIITPRKIVQEFRGNSSECKTALWIPSFVEVFGDSYARYDYEGLNSNNKHLPLFQDTKNLQKLFEGEPNYWWLRSPCDDSTFYNVNPTGYVTTNHPTGITDGVLPCFTISKVKEPVVCTDELFLNFIQ